MVSTSYPLAPHRCVRDIGDFVIGKLDLTNSTEKFEGPWFTTQLTISLSVGLTSFFLFSYCRTRWPLIFAPRTKLKGGDNRVPSRDYTD